MDDKWEPVAKLSSNQLEKNQTNKKHPEGDDNWHIEQDFFNKILNLRIQTEEVNGVNVLRIDQTK